MVNEKNKEATPASLSLVGIRACPFDSMSWIYGHKDSASRRRHIPTLFSFLGICVDNKGAGGNYVGEKVLTAIQQWGLGMNQRIIENGVSVSIWLLCLSWWMNEDSLCWIRKFNMCAKQNEQGQWNTIYQTSLAFVWLWLSCRKWFHAIWFFLCVKRQQ